MPAWNPRANEIFFRALELEDLQLRQKLLNELCGADASLRQAVERLLAANEAAGSFLEKPAMSLQPDRTGTFSPENAGPQTIDAVPETVDRPGRDEHVGAVIAGKYKLIEEIGEGGMGQVFMAQQTEPVKRAVAVKVIKAGMDSKAVLARFEAERQALAMMDHPNIARVLDAGATEAGRPFFVMELVKGVPITQFCDDRKLTPRQRLELFVPVCQAIQHAHQKGIIHRDIKPSNVLVAMYDDRAVPKVIDFGVAKATGQTLTDMTLMTGFGAVVGTPEYMSPEQASLNNMDVDTRSDVYSLGVLLYELLTGSTPMDRKSLGKAALLEILRIVREVEVPRPSHKLSTAEALPSISANRGTEPAKLSKLMKGELDWLVLKALEKDRTRRYETANGFARDIQRFLDDEVVEARPPSAGYRLKKFVRRHKGQVIAAGLVLFALLGGIVGTTFGLLEAKRQERLAVAAADEERNAKDREAERAEGERVAKLDAEAKKSEAQQAQARAEAGEKLAGERLVQVEAEKAKAIQEQQIAQAVKDFLQTKLLAQADTTAQANQLLRAGGLAAEAKFNPTIRELLDRAAKELAPDKIEANFPQQPLVQAEILLTVGTAYFGVGEAATAIDFLTRSVEQFKAKLGPAHPGTLTSMNNLAGAYQAAGKLALALPLKEETLKLTKAKLGPAHPDTLMSMNNLAGAYYSAGKLDLALPLLEETLKLRKAKLGPAHPDTLTSMNNLAISFYAAGKNDLDLPLLEETLKLRKAKLGPDHHWTLGSMNNLAAAYQAAGKLDLALPLYEETLKLMKAKLGPDHPNTLQSMNNLAAAYQAAGKLALALPLLEETLKLRKAKLGPDHPDTLMSMVYLAGAYREAGKLDLALPLVEETLKLQKVKLGPDHPSTLGSMNALASTYWSAKQLDKSIPLFEELLPLLEKKLGRQHPETQMTVANLGVNYMEAGRRNEAIPLLEEAYRASNKHASLRWVGPELLYAYAKAGKPAEARKVIDELLADARKNLPKDSPQLAGMMAKIGMSLLEMKGYAEAEPLLLESLTIREKSQPDLWTTFNTQSMLGGALLGQKKYAEAEPLLLKGYEGLKAREKSIPPQGITRISEALDRLIELYTATNKPDEAKKYRELRAKYPEVGPQPRTVK
jgi:eukaryotic-like serine/threonine-protein kinase